MCTHIYAVECWILSVIDFIQCADAVPKRKRHLYWHHWSNCSPFWYYVRQPVCLPTPNELSKHSRCLCVHICLCYWRASTFVALAGSVACWNPLGDPFTHSYIFIYIGLCLFVCMPARLRKNATWFRLNEYLLNFVFFTFDCRRFRFVPILFHCTLFPFVLVLV